MTTLSKTRRSENLLPNQQLQETEEKEDEEEESSCAPLPSRPQINRSIHPGWTEGQQLNPGADQNASFGGIPG